MEALTVYLPLIFGIGLITIGVLYLAMPVHSLVKLDRYVHRWVHAAPNPYTRMELMVPVYKGIGGWVAISGLVYILMNLSRMPF